MADPRMTLLDLLAKSEQGVDPTFLRDGLKLLAQELMDANFAVGTRWLLSVDAIRRW
jgi:hypothetical protein